MAGRQRELLELNKIEILLRKKRINKIHERMNDAERADIHKKLMQKLGEALNPNLDNQNAKRIALCAELYRLFLTRAGKEYIKWQVPAMERLRVKILAKIEEFAPLNVARVNAEYMEAAEEMKIIIENVRRCVEQQ